MRFVMQFVCFALHASFICFANLLVICTFCLESSALLLAVLVCDVGGRTLVLACFLACGMQSCDVLLCHQNGFRTVVRNFLVYDLWGMCAVFAGCTFCVHVWHCI